MIEIMKDTNKENYKRLKELSCGSVEGYNKKYKCLQFLNKNYYLKTEDMTISENVLNNLTIHESFNTLTH